MTDPDTPIDLVLHTPGGLVLASLQIARAIRRHRGRVTVFIPNHAMSGGPLIALAADEIVMSEHAVLGPVRPQIRSMAGPSIISVLSQKPVEKLDDETLILADMAEKAVDQLRHCTTEDLLAHGYTEEERRDSVGSYRLIGDR